jgi:hypothetical protein
MTAQLEEVLIQDGIERMLECCPPLPEGHPRIVVRELIGEDDDIYDSTACWRGYRGIWELRDGKLLLTSLSGRLTLVGEAPLHADWITGVIRVSRGEELTYVHMGFYTVYEFDDLFAVERGVVVASSSVDNRLDPDPLARDDRLRAAMPGGMTRFVDEVDDEEPAS